MPGLTREGEELLDVVEEVVAVDREGEPFAVVIGRSFGAPLTYVRAGLGEERLGFLPFLASEGGLDLATVALGDQGTE